MERDEKIEALIARMTPEEKAGQLSTFSDKIRLAALGINPDAGTGGPEKLLQAVKEGKVGSLFNGIGAAKGREVQRVAVEESRLGIPLLFGADVIHGLFTVFPIPLGEAASFEPELAERTARATAEEATAMGIQWTFAPMVDVARDQRWGRVAEGSGEDVHLGIEFATARVRGFQGPDLRAEDSLLACPKHFAAYGGVAAGMDYNYVEISEATLRDVHLPAFKASFDAGALTVMSAFNDVAGVPSSGNRWLMTDILRDEWHFRGFVVSDFTADLELIDHGYAADRRDATKKSALAGLNMSMESGLYNEHLPDLVAKGEVPGELLDELVRGVLRVKAAMGLFENPYRSLATNRKFDAGAHHALAREAGKRSIVLLKNEGAVLPLRKSGQRIALVGPYASDSRNLEGTWALFGDKSKMVNIENGIRGALADPAALTVVRGCRAEEAIEGGIEAAVAAAQQADVVLLAIGEPQVYSGEAQSRTQIVVPAAQQALAEAVAAVGKPMVVLLKTGRALALTGAVRDAQAVLVAWFLGSQTGPAVADVVFGDYNPSARLPVSFPQDAGQLDPKRSYAWVCCLCINQHRVHAAAERGQVVPFEQFREEFAERVEGIGNVVALMTPWRAPTYVTRVWTNFEIFTAISLGPETCNVFITMPRREAADLRQALLEGSSFDEMWRVLSTLRIEEANASVEEDKSRIFHMIKQGPGFHSLNCTVSSYLQASFLRCCEGFLEERVTDVATADREVATLYSQVGRLHLRVRRGSMLQRAIDAFGRSRGILKRSGSMETVEGAMLLRDIGTATALRGNLTDALEVYSEAREILGRLGKLGTLESAKLLSSMGMTRRAIGDLKGALRDYQEAKRIHEQTGTLETPDFAGLLTGIGIILSQLGDLSGALEALQAACDIRVMTGTLATPDGAGMLSCLGNAMRLNKDTEGALRVLKQAQELYEQLGLLETPGGALLLRYVGAVRMEIGELDAALQVFTHAEGILKSTQTMHSPTAAQLLCDLSLLHLRLGDVAAGFEAYVEAQKLHTHLNLQDSELAQRIWEGGRKPEIVGCALAGWRQCRRVWEPTEVRTPEPSK